MGTIPPNLQEFLLIEFGIERGALEPNLRGLVLSCRAGESRFLLTRGQLLDLAEACRKAAEAMPKPS